MITKNSHPIDDLELMAYLDGELSRERASAAAAHLEESAHCKALASDLRRISHELASWQIEVPEAQITARLTVALEDHERAWKEKASSNRRQALRQPWPGRRFLVGGLVAAALATLLVLISTPSLMRSHLATKTVGSIDYYYSPPSQARPPLETYDSLSKLEKDQTRSSPTSALPESTISTGPMIVRTAELALTTSDFDQARTRLEEVLKRHKGYLGELNVTGATGAARTLTATLRVPAEQLDATIAEVKNLGHVDSETQNGEEVTQQYVDLQARLLNARNSEQRLTQILQRTGKLSDVLAVEEQIERVRENIERMEAEKKELTKQVAFSTLNMKVAEDYKERVHVVPDSTSTRLRNAAVEGYELMVAGLINVLLFLEAWGPSLLLWGAILFFPARWLWRRRRARLL